MLSLQPSNHQGCHGEVHTGMPHKVACNKQVPCYVQAQCCKWPQLLHSCVNHCSKNKRQKTLTGTILLISPYMYISICVYTYTHTHTYIRGFPNGSAVKNLPTMGKLQKIWVQFLDWEDSPGGGHSNPLYYYSLENTKYRGAWQATVHKVASLQRVKRDWNDDITSHISHISRWIPRT